MKIAVLLANMGGPDSLDAVEPFLLELFKDPDIIDIPLPGFLRHFLVQFLAKKRAVQSRLIYEKIGGKTPLIEITCAQANELKKQLNANIDHQFEVFVGMRYWRPSLREVWPEIIKQNFDKIVVLSMYPFYSTTTTGSIVNEIKRLIKKYHTPEETVLLIDRYGAHPQFIHSMAEQLEQYVNQSTHEDEIHLLFSAHSIPLKRVDRGDPYFNEVKEAIHLLRTKFPEERVKFHLAFQSKLGPIKWLSPSTSDKIELLALQGVKHLLVYPLGFVAENSETLYEIGMLYHELALEKGIEKFVRIEALNARPTFIKALKEIVMEKLTETKYE